jgi:hypothetical protein
MYIWTLADKNEHINYESFMLRIVHFWGIRFHDLPFCPKCRLVIKLLKLTHAGWMVKSALHFDVESQELQIVERNIVETKLYKRHIVEMNL